MADLRAAAQALMEIADWYFENADRLRVKEHKGRPETPMPVMELGNAIEDVHAALAEQPTDAERGGLSQRSELANSPRDSDSRLAAPSLSAERATGKQTFSWEERP